MGMPITSYTVLRALVYGNSEYERPIALEALEPFNLFAFILHDPETHKEFDFQLNRLFEKLDYITGDRLLFLALVDPPSEWMREARRRPYFHKFNSWATNQLLDPQNSIKSSEPGVAASSLARGLSISPEKLPCIVITKDFRSSNFVWVRTSSRTIESQLGELGFLARNFDKWSLEDSEIHSNLLQIRDRLDFDYDRGECFLEKSMAEALSNVLSFIVLSNKSDYMSQSIAKKQVKETLSGLFQKISRVKSHYNEDQIEIFDTLCINIMELLSLLDSRENLRVEDFIPINKTYIEEDSYKILRTAQRVFSLLNNNQLPEVVKSDPNESFDFTPGVICLSKIFEKEINLSVVHWLRKELGITLPEFFNKPQPRINAVYQQDTESGIKIDFNMNRNGKWLPPAIGQSEIVCQDFIASKSIEGWNEETWRLLLDKWKIIRKYRNEAAHTELVTSQALNTVKDALTYLAQNDYFEKFYQLKLRYSGRTY